MEKKIEKITTQSFTGGMGFRTTGISQAQEYMTEPFLVFAEFYLDQPVFGAHPHAGVSILTYVLPDSEGSMVNRDSQGDYSIIKAGGVHVTQAGSGIQHDEFPSENGIPTHAFQIWINHTDKDRLVAPKSFRSAPEEVPIWEIEDIRLRVIQGSYKGVRSPIELVTKTLIFDVTLKPNTTIEFEAEEMAFIYNISGAFNIAGKTVQGTSVVSFEKEGNRIVVETKQNGANFMFVSAVPNNEPIAYGGSFVMTTEEQLRETRKRFQRGEMGQLDDLK
jgi:redox-sensitive bicupin YhaK (pirin superfamily)